MNMTRIRLFAASLALVIGFQGNCFAQDNSHDIVKIYLASDNRRMSIHPGKHLVDSLSVQCPDNLPSCTLALSAMDQICGRLFNPATWQIVVEVDGAEVDKLDQSSGQVFCSLGHWQGMYQVGPGPHNVQLFSDIGHNLGVVQSNWAVNYTVTTP